MKFIQSPLIYIIVTDVVFVGKSIYFQTGISIISFTDEPLSEFHQLLISCLPI
ncbi:MULTISPECIES: hypothetical protein [Bacillus cereus group]|uniref:hypothetical protein n=1 Tax=Bacillus cereus group TaxID=86661 RepID=UPI0008C1A5F4|nr:MULTISPECIES: hypothetical protein [Bacillus cereus group]MBJ7936172.1 hypothetical protein [Bacillus cereus]SEJ77523.1 hypothetical protein SAMN04487780_115127 [Bacillus thuringiensis]HDR8473179.1 hypothetical protein [Bacillus cereus]